MLQEWNKTPYEFGSLDRCDRTFINGYWEGELELEYRAREEARMEQAKQQSKIMARGLR